MTGIKRDRIQWMLAHRHLWEGWPYVRGIWRRDDPIVDWVWQACVEHMKADGLISPTTRWHDVQVGQYIDRARLEMGVFN